jgi:hypothetical protein
MVAPAVGAGDALDAGAEDDDLEQTDLVTAAEVELAAEQAVGVTNEPELSKGL